MMMMEKSVLKKKRHTLNGIDWLVPAVVGYEIASVDSIRK